MQISVSVQATLRDIMKFFVMALYDASNPGVCLESQQILPSPPTTPFQVTFLYNCLNGHTYNLKLWESVDATPTGTQRNYFTQAVNGGIINVRKPLYLETDIDAGLTNGTTSYTNLTFAGWDYWLERIGQGTMVPDSTTDTTPNYHQVSTGGFNLVQAGDTFQPNEKFNVFFVPQVIPGALGIPSQAFSTGKIIIADYTLISSDADQGLLIQSATNKITLTMPNISLISDYTFFYIYSCGGSHINCSVVGFGSDKFNWQGTNKSQIILGQVEVLKVFKAFGVWNVDNDLSGYKAVGESFLSYKIPINAIQSSGQLLLRNVYARLWEWVQTLASGIVVTDTTWLSTFVVIDGFNFYTKKGCFSTGTITSGDSANFRLPLKDFMTAKSIDGTTRLPGSSEQEQIIAHQHESSTGTLPASLYGESPSSRLIGGYKDQFTAKNDLVSQPVDNTGVYIQRAGNKNLVDNIGEFSLIRI